MKILIVGGGAREHALAWKIAKSPEVEKLFCAPGNAGIAEKAECVDIAADRIEELAAFASEKNIDMTVVGPEAPLAAGIVDAFQAAGLCAFGPTAAAAAVESSKSYAKRLMEKYNIPTARGRVFTNFNAACRYVDGESLPIVVKADGLAAGKGVSVCRTRKQAVETLQRMMVEEEFGEAGRTVVIEECLTGQEASFIAFTDGRTVLPLPASQDHKQVYDEDKGPNTGGMGAYSPAPVVDAVMRKKIMDQVMQPAVRALAAEGRPYRGVLYAGLMIDRERVRVVEFNCRFGDPEAQPLLMRTRSDIVPVMRAVVEGGLENCKLDIDPRAAVCVVMAARGYPGSYSKGMEIKGVNNVKRMKDVEVFHAGTANKNGAFVTAGGRVLGITALGNDIEKAVSRVYEAAGKISWQGEHYRTDIGKKALEKKAVPPAVGIIMGSDSDLSVMSAAAEMLKRFDVPYEMTVASAHRTPEKAGQFAATARKKGIKVIIAGAGHAAHLAGAMAAQTTLPVLGVPIDSSALSGFDALLSTVQMPPGVPVATMAVGKPGAKNAAVTAAQILALSDPELEKRLEAYKVSMADEVEKKARSLEG
ncbi:MAG: phosphoribosylamine--glycine ligase [Desulfobacteraceae bacterium]|nr:phosphoribosylamine--glycine ligase [Desulfobacteraceae bacterium]MCF8094485.1 phosphoribosylamine--glycine ligase [Desulfobacteraceae bacterium]